MIPEDDGALERITTQYSELQYRFSKIGCRNNWVHYKKKLVKSM